MKIVHAADLHIDSPMVGAPRYEGMPVARLRTATRDAFSNLISLVIEEQAALLLLAGDLFDDNWRDYATGLFFLNELSRLREIGTRVVLVRGNHDAQNNVTKRLTWPAHVFELSSKKPESRVFDDLGVAVHGQSYAERATTADLGAGYPAPISGALNIGLLHTSLDGRPGHASYAPTKIETLIAKGYDYWALGHVHAREVIARDPYIVFPGNLQGRSVRETGDKGATVIETEGSLITQIDHHALDVVRWFSLDVDAKSAEDDEAALALVARALERAARDADSRLGIARVTVSATPKLLGRLLSSEDAFVAEVRRIANELGDAEFVTERVGFKSAPEEDDLGLGDAPLFAFARAIDPAFVARAKDKIAEFSQRMPEASRKLLALDDEETLRALSEEALSWVTRSLGDDEP